MKVSTLRLILGDQLNAAHSWYQQVDDSVVYLIAELHQEAIYVVHHRQKITAFFAAMGQFAEALKKSGHQVIYLTLDDTKQYQSLDDLIIKQAKALKVTRFEYQQPDEFRLQTQLSRLQQTLSIESRRVDSEHFLLQQDEIPTYFQPQKAIRMETFYRKMRKRFNVLMEGDQPLGGKWNYDQENRQSLKPADIAEVIAPKLFKNKVTEILERLDKHRVKTLGSCDSHLFWPVNRQQALQLLKFFTQKCLINFGRFQDAMTDQSPHSWSLYHSRLSFAINSKMLSPMLVIQKATDAYWQSKTTNNPITLAQVEGFIRQILGWREYMRGMYWINMPEYASLNELEATRKLPDFFWNGETKMNCLKQSIQQSLDYAYAHHIQRLMVTGNFCLLTGIEPDQVDRWYLGIYIDAIEWVEMPNTRGMSLFADGGLIASKPYSAGGNYINKMSDYCKSCHYKIKQKVGEQACPMNSFYWHFMVQHRERLERNPRIGMVFRSWDKQSAEQQRAVLQQAEDNLINIENL